MLVVVKKSGSADVKEIVVLERRPVIRIVYNDGTLEEYHHHSNGGGLVGQTARAAEVTRTRKRLSLAAK